MTARGISPIPQPARAFQGKRAGIVSRVAAATLDGLVVVAALVIGYASWAGLLFLVDPLHFTFPDPSLIFSVIAGCFVLVLYLAAAWTLTGRSYGGAVMGLRVVNRRGDRLRPVGALLRAVLCALVPIGLFWCAVSRRNRSFQDIVLGTSVIYDWQARVPPRSAR